LKRHGLGEIKLRQSVREFGRLSPVKNIEVLEKKVGAAAVVSG
jgi:hypothetical protein